VTVGAGVAVSKVLPALTCLLATRAGWRC